MKSTKENLHERNFRLSKEEAHSGSPEDVSLCGEEDPGAALETIIRKNQEDYEKGVEQRIANNR